MTDNATMSPADFGAIMGNNDGFGGGAWWIIILFLFAFCGFGNGGWGNQGATAATTADIQRAVDLNSIQTGQANLAADVQRGIYEINGATKDVAYNNLSEIRDLQNVITTGFANQQSCCCDMKQTVMENRYLDAQNASNIMANTTAQTQKILDALAQNQINDLQSKVNTLEMQNAIGAATAGVVRYPMATTYSSGSNPFCGCGCNG